MAFLSTTHSLAGGRRFLTVIALLLLIVGCGTQSSEIREAQSKDVSCVTGQAVVRNVPMNVVATGAIEADKSIMVSTRMMGWVRKIYVEEGQLVHQGDPLLSIDDADMRAKKAQVEAGIAEAEAVLANAERMTARFENLYAEKSVSKQQLDDVRTGRDRAAAGVARAKAGLREVNVHLSYLDIVAPVDGVVVRKIAEEGNMANPGMPLITMESTGRVKVVAHLGEKDVTMVKAGDLVEVDVTSLPNARFTVPLERIIQAANPGSRTYDIEAYLDNADGRLKSGMFARVTVSVGTREAVLVPREAIIHRGQLNGVWIVDPQQTVSLRWIRLGHQMGDQVEVLSGLNGHETVVLSASAPLAEGDKAVR